VVLNNYERGNTMVTTQDHIIAYDILSDEKKVREAQRAGTSSVRIGVYENVPVGVIELYAQNRRQVLELDLARDIYAEEGGPKDFMKVMSAAKKATKEVFKSVIDTSPELAPPRERSR
jgi:hypothetical protein